MRHGAPDDGQEPRALAIVQARMSSRRLPGKVLADVGGEPMLVLQLRRLARARRLARIVVATSAEPSDDAIADVVENLPRDGVDGASIDLFRGALADVLGRFVGAAAGHDGPVVRITADCPFIDPDVVDELLGRFAAASWAAYGSNFQDRTYPDGLDAEVFTPEALALADRLATDPADREHVTTFMRRHPDRFPSVSLVDARRLGRLRWTVDDPEDLEFVRAVVARLGESRYAATMSEVLDAVRRPPSLAGPGGLRG